ncbi:MAG: GNAT family N-acetyltransferase [Gaiellales bacterium]
MDGLVGRRVATAGEFRALAEPLLTADEARHTVMLGVLNDLERTPGRYPEFALWVVEEAGEAQAAALRTPPFHGVVAQPRSSAALHVLASVMQEDAPGLPGVNGTRPEVDEFAAEWARLSGGRTEARMQLILHRLDRLEETPPTPGRMRDATAADRDLLIEWMAAFSAETGVQGGAEDLARGIDAHLGKELALMVWEDAGAVVSLAGSRETSPGCARIGPVYTPPELRRRGYATTIVRELTAARLSAGARTMLLFTDLANPTSNAIYARIGYRPIAEAVEVDFLPG